MVPDCVNWEWLVSQQIGVICHLGVDACQEDFGRLLFDGVFVYSHVLKAVTLLLGNPRLMQVEGLGWWMSARGHIVTLHLSVSRGI
jgi:hypothetical protein